MVVRKHGVLVVRVRFSAPRFSEKIVGPCTNLGAPTRITRDMRQEFHKLVRDGIPEKIRKGGRVPSTRILSTEELSTELKRKLVEESRELKAADSPEAIIEELADVKEVLEALRAALFIKREKVEEARRAKREKRGGFDGRIFLEYVE